MNANQPRRPLPVRLVPAAGLVLLSPICAEYLIGYGESVGDPVPLLAGLLILGPLYGAPALIIREVTRRSRRGWPTIILLAAAFGVIQAGLVDQSLFNPAFGDIDYWDERRHPTLIPAVGTSAHMAVSFVAGHVIWSIGAPIAVMESLAYRRGPAPWLGRTGLVVATVLYLLASLLVFTDLRTSQQFLAPAPQLASAAAIALALVAAAFLVRPGGRPSARRGAVPRAVPRPAWLTAASAVAFTAYTLAPANWAGVTGAVAVLAAITVALTRLSWRAGWNQAHRLAIAGGALLSYAGLAYLVQPLSTPSMAAKLVHNTLLALSVAGLLMLAFRVVGPRPGRSKAINASSDTTLG